MPEIHPVIYRILADLTVLFHALFLVFVVFGGLLVLRRPAWARLHVPAALWGAAIEFGGWICPLTPLENRLRLLGGEEPYGGGFIARYLLPVVYPGALTREIQIAFGTAVVLLNLAVYALMWRRRRYPPASPPSPFS